MTTRHLIFKLYIIFLFTQLLVAGGCAETDSTPSADDYVAPCVTLMLRGQEAGHQSRAEGFDPLPNELIHSWKVFFVDADGTVVETVTDNGIAEEGVEEDEVRVFLPDGNYTVYAFANISDNDLPLSGNDLIEDTSSITLSDGMKEKLANNQLNETEFIPMTGTRTLSISQGVLTGSDNVIEVMRMVAKMEFVFANESSMAVTLKDITIKSVAEGDIPVFNAAEVSAGTDATYTKAINHEIKNGGNESYSSHFYLREVKSEHATGSFPITVTLQRGEGNTETINALLHDLSEIRRNDWVKVPLTITDYALDLDVTFYPPIGGYPPVLTEKKEDEYYITFGTGGWFSIRVGVTDRASGSMLPDSDVAIGIVEDSIINHEMFRRQPFLDEAGEITGELKSPSPTPTTDTDKSELMLRISVKRNSAGVESTTEFKRKLTIVRSIQS